VACQLLGDTKIAETPRPHTSKGGNSLDCQPESAVYGQRFERETKKGPNGRKGRPKSNYGKEPKKSKHKIE